MLLPHPVSDGADAGCQRRTQSSGTLAHATVLAVRRLGVVEGVSLVELDLKVSAVVDGVLSTEVVTTTEPISLVLAARAHPGAALDVFLRGTPGAGVVIDW